MPSDAFGVKTDGNTFVPVPEGVSVARLRSAALRRAQQNAIREIVPSRILSAVATISPAAGRLLRKFMRGPAPKPEANLGGRAYWVVSPNVRNHDKFIDEWRRTCVRARAAFMGWGPEDDQHGAIGPKFAGRSPGGIKRAMSYSLPGEMRRYRGLLGSGWCRAVRGGVCKGFGRPSRLDHCGGCARSESGLDPHLVFRSSEY